MVPKVRASRREYKSAFQKHLHAYSHWENTGSETSKRLILIYCVECGLKYKIMESLRIQRLEDAQENIQHDLGSHNFYLLLKRLNQAGIYRFPTIQTIHGDKVDPNTYHLLCRYSIQPTKTHQNQIQQYDDQLEKIAEWLKERV